MAKEDLIEKRLTQETGLNKMLDSFQNSLNLLGQIAKAYPELANEQINENMSNLNLIKEKCLEKNIAIPDSFLELKQKLESMRI
jgi:hypothetical protein